MSETPPLPPAAVLIQHPVADFDQWYGAFEAHESARVANGIVGHHLNRAEADPNLVTAYMAVADIDKAKAFAQSDEIRAAMQDGGVTGPPDIAWVTPERVEIVWDRELPAMLVSHSVADFDAWLAGYNQADELRVERGIVGHAANRSLDDPSRVFIYHQAESFDTLRAFLADPELGEAMRAAGVTSEPEVSYHTGGMAKMY